MVSLPCKTYAVGHDFGRLARLSKSVPDLDSPSESRNLIWARSSHLAAILQGKLPAERFERCFAGDAERESLIQSTIGHLPEYRSLLRLVDVGSGQQVNKRKSYDGPRASRDASRLILRSACNLDDLVAKMAGRKCVNGPDMLSGFARRVLNRTLARPLSSYDRTLVRWMREPSEAVSLF
jgi:hypothetical protein